MFKYFHAYVQRELGKQLNCVNVNNGEEYRESFEIYYKKHNITLDKKFYVEKINLTISERIRYVLSHAKLF